MQGRGKSVLVFAFIALAASACTKPMSGYFVQGDRAMLSLDDLDNDGQVPDDAGTPRSPGGDVGGGPMAQPTGMPSSVPTDDVSYDCKPGEVKVEAEYKCHGPASAPVWESMHCGFKLEARELGLHHSVEAKYAAAQAMDPGSSSCVAVGKDSVLGKLENLPDKTGTYHIQGHIHACLDATQINPSGGMSNVRVLLALAYLKVMAQKDGAQSGPDSARKGNVEVVLAGLSGDPRKAGYCLREHGRISDDAN
jgi:hypothetical protein